MKARRQSRQYRELMRLQQAISKQQAQVAQAKQVATEASASRPTVGMPADDVLKLPGYAKKNRTHPPRILGYDRNGLKVRWYYKDIMLTIARLTPDGYYQVMEVRERQQNDKEAQPEA